jgi:phosphoribosyl 1,2-cyclic phosphodiesterase
MKITFLGTKAYIESTKRRHWRHTSTLISYKNKNVMIDCGFDWAKKVWEIKPDAIILTHAHPDHAWGLKEGSPCPVYATRTTWKLIKNYLIPEGKRKIIYLSKPNKIFNMQFQAFRNEHSLIAPAVGYKITAGSATIFYAGDVVYIPNTKKTLKDSQLYIGDGSTVTQSLVRRKGDRIYGHATVTTQLTWCKKAGIPWAIFTHCGSQIVETHGQTIAAEIKKLGKERNVKAEIAYDGQVVVL